MILESSVVPTIWTFFCNASRDLMKVTAPKAQIGPKSRDKETAGVVQF